MRHWEALSPHPVPSRHPLVPGEPACLTSRERALGNWILSFLASGRMVACCGSYPSNRWEVGPLF